MYVITLDWLSREEQAIANNERVCFDSTGLRSEEMSNLLPSLETFAKVPPTIVMTILIDAN